MASPTPSVLRSLAAALSAFAMVATPAVAATPLVPLASDAECNRCAGYLLPGAPVPSPQTVWRIDSDLPELYNSNGVLYATTSVLPPFDTHKDGPVPVEMRTQRSPSGFTAIDGSFEVFLYHLSENHAPGEKRRIVVLARNSGKSTATVTPRQAIFHGPNSARPGGVESLLGEAVFAEKWETPVVSAAIAPGDSAIVGFTKQLCADVNGPDTTKAVFVTGTLRAGVASADGTKPALDIFVVSIPGTPDHSAMKAAALALLGTGANSGETFMDLRIPPPSCHVRRVVGVAPNVLWKSGDVTLDVAALPGDAVTFPMAVPGVQAVGCETARQTVDLALHPPYVHPDSVGNYMMEYRVDLRLENGGKTPRTADVRFGKTDQKVGLVHQVLAGDAPAADAALTALPPTITWAGKGSDGVVEPRFDASLLTAGEIEIPPGGAKTVSLRLMVLGTSCLPYDLHVTSGVPAP